jgi:hypothetical protein
MSRAAFGLSSACTCNAVMVLLLLSHVGPHARCGRYAMLYMDKLIHTSGWCLCVCVRCPCGAVVLWHT